MIYNARIIVRLFLEIKGSTQDDDDDNNPKPAINK